ncbi:MAG: penicillin-binding transpeptidase domain-containing protein [Anaerolineae bacterium]
MAGYLTQEQADAAYNEKLQYGNGQFEFNAPHFVQMIWSQLERDYPDVLYQGGLEVVTTLDLDWQRAAEAAALRQVIAEQAIGRQTLAQRTRRGASPRSQNRTRCWRCSAISTTTDGSQDKAASAINMSPRQPGSTLKPFTYALTFRVNADLAVDARHHDPRCLHALHHAPVGSYTPANCGLVEHGPVLIREALASSTNIPAVVALQHVGVNNLVELLHRLGVSTLTDPLKLISR